MSTLEYNRTPKTYLSSKIPSGKVSPIQGNWLSLLFYIVSEEDISIEDCLHTLDVFIDNDDEKLYRKIKQKDIIKSKKHDYYITHKNRVSKLTDEEKEIKKIKAYARNNEYRRERRKDESYKQLQNEKQKLYQRTRRRSEKDES